MSAIMRKFRMQHLNIFKEVLCLILTMIVLGGCSSPESPSPNVFSSNTLLLAIAIVIIRFLVVPSILGGMFFLSFYITKLPIPTKDEESQESIEASKWFAFWLSLGIFVLIVTLNAFTHSFVPTQSLQAFDRPWLYVVSGLVTGFAIMAAVCEFLPGRRIPISIFIIILSSASLSSLYFYILVDMLRDAVLIVSVSLLVGSLIYAVLNPKPMKHLYPTWKCHCGRTNAWYAKKCAGCRKLKIA